jgi:putative sigma-54 modulation protein
VSHQEETKAPFAAHTLNQDKRTAGRTDAAHTQLEIRSGGEELEPGLREWIYDRVGRQLGKYAPQIDRIQVRFGDENGPRGGNDKCCMVHVVLHKLAPVVVEIRGDTQREAFDLAANRAERATRRTMEKHGISTHRHQHKGQDHVDASDAALAGSAFEDDDETSASDDQDNEDSLLGRREGHRREQIEALVAGANEQPDTSERGVAADDHRPGTDHTATRNTKLNTEGMAYRLEDSTTGTPSRKSTRGGTNRIKHGNPLTQRTKAAVHSPKETATRASVQKH